MVPKSKGKSMSFKTRVLNWFRSRKSLIKENQDLELALERAYAMLQHMNYTHNFSVVESQREIENLQKHALYLLGGVALQHQGEMVIKDEFMQMVAAPDSDLSVEVVRNEENNATVIKVSEKSKQESDVDTEDQE